jgi:hypothetical protein
VDRAHGSGGPRAGGGLRVHGGPVDGARPELTGVRVHRRSRAQDLVVAAWGARGEDGDPYPGWREWVEGLGQEVEDDPVMGQTGQSGPRWPGCGWAGVGISKGNRDGLPWPLGQIDGLNRRAYRRCF